MIDLRRFSNSIQRPLEDTEDWFRPVLASGRTAAFVDTGFLLALIMEGRWSDMARRHFEGAERTTFYTTTLVFAEVVRQIAKTKGAGERGRGWFDHCRELFIDNGCVVKLCAPPVDLTIAAYRQFLAGPDRLVGLDLCDAVSIQVLEYAQHRRVFGFDQRHFGTCGALLEPELA